MKSFIVLALLVAVVAAAPAGPEAEAQVVRSSFDNIGVDGFSSLFETDNGIKAESRGTLKDAGLENLVLEIVGSYSYPGPDGVLYTVDYVANENGFQPRGAHLPA